MLYYIPLMIKMSSLSIDKGPAVLTTLWSLTSASLLFVLARLLVRLRILQKAGWDDILITLSIILAYIYDVILTIAVKSGYGRQQSTLSSEELSNSIKFIMAGFAPGLLSIVVPKLAVAALLIRTMNPSPRQKWFLWGTVLGSGVLLMGCVVILYLQCQPASEIWEMNFAEGSCWSMTVLVDYSIVVGGIAATVDAYLAIYPAVIIWNLHMGIKKKLGLSFALGLGACACIMAVVKCTRIPTLYNMTNITYASADLFIWTSIESNTIIIAASVPTIAPLIELTLGKRILNTTEKDSNRTESRHLARPQQVHIHQNQKRARAWLSAINIEQSYHECSIQRGSSAGRSQEDLEGLTPTEGAFGGGNGIGAIQRRDDVIIKYERWPEGIWGRDRGVYMEKV